MTNSDKLVRLWPLLSSGWYVGGVQRLINGDLSHIGDAMIDFDTIEIKGDYGWEPLDNRKCGDWLSMPAENYRIKEQENG